MQRSINCWKSWISTWNPSKDFKILRMQIRRSWRKHKFSLYKMYGQHNTYQQISSQLSIVVMGKQSICFICIIYPEKHNAPYFNMWSLDQTTTVIMGALRINYRDHEGMGVILSLYSTILTYVVIIIRYNWFLIMSSFLLSQSFWFPHFHLRYSIKFTSSKYYCKLYDECSIANRNFKSKQNVTLEKLENNFNYW